MGKRKFYNLTQTNVYISEEQIKHYFSVLWTLQKNMDFSHDKPLNIFKISVGNATMREINIHNIILKTLK